MDTCDKYDDSELTKSERAKIAHKRDCAIQLMQARVIANDRHDVYTSLPKSKLTCKKFGSGGFIVEDKDTHLVSQNIRKYEKDEELSDSEFECTNHNRRKRKQTTHSNKLDEDAKPIADPLELPIPPDVDKPVCDHCNRMFDDSFLCRNFDVLVCDRCRDPKGIHKLITRSTAKERYLLTDIDLDIRTPILGYLLKRNPHNSFWGDMRLYLEAQIAERSLDIWGSEEALVEECDRRVKRVEQTKLKNYNKKLKELKLQTRSSLFMETHKNHEHIFEDEHFDCKTDTYYRSCIECNYKSTFEKL